MKGVEQFKEKKGGGSRTIQGEKRGVKGVEQFKEKKGCEGSRTSFKLHLKVYKGFHPQCFCNSRIR